MAVQRTFCLTPQLLAQHAGGEVLCLDRQAEGRSYRLSDERPGVGADGNEPLYTHVDVGEVEEATKVIAVRIGGVLEQRAGYHDYCGGWTDGHDAVAERMTEALAAGDVVMIIDSPGGAAAGVEEAIRTVLKAKAEHGRRVYAFADELIGSAAYWWACSVADEIYIPKSGVVGSIGARAAHASTAGALKKQGVEVTYFVWPGDGKIAYAQERPLSDIGRARGDRDVALVGEAFAKAVAEGRGISMEAIVELNADCLTGKAAVDAGLADGVASMDDVIEHALAVASGEESNMAIKTEEQNEPEATEDPTEEASDEPMPEEAEGDEPEPDAEAEPDPEAEDEEEDEEAMEDEEHKASARARRPRRSADAAGSLNEILGVPAGASGTRIKSAAARMRTTLDKVMTALGATDEDDLVGAAHAAASDLKRMAKVEAQNKKLNRQRRAERRMAAAKKLVAANVPGFARGDVFLDKIGARGERKLALAPEFQSMKLEVFESMVTRKVKTGRGRGVTTTPFSVDREEAAAAPAARSLKASEESEAVRRAAKNTQLDPKELAASHQALFGNQNHAGDPAI